MEESPVKKALSELRAYLHNNLRIDKDFIAGLSAAGLVGDSDADNLRSSVTQGGNEALYGLLHHIEWFYDEEMLEKFCVFLDDYSKKARPRLREVAARIRSELEKHQSGPIHPPDPQQQDDVPGPTDTGPPSSPPATQGEPTPTVSTMDERSQKIKKIVDMYRSESTEVSLPEIPELEDDFDSIMGTLNAKLSFADRKVIYELKGMVQMKYRRYIHGVKTGKLPHIPDTASGLYEFIAENSTPYEILFVHHTVEVLDCKDLKMTLQSYESNLANHLRLTLTSYKRRKVTLPQRKDHTHLAMVRSKEQTLLSLVLHIKEYLMKYLQLEETIFEGFGEGCTILFYSILKVDAVLLAPKILSHSAELKRMFDITHLVVFDYFACDLERAAIELPVSQGTALVKAETALEETKASLDDSLMKSEQLKHELISTRLKQKSKEDELEKEKEMFKRSTVILARQKDELERKISTLKGALCKEHLDTIDKAVEGYQEVVTFFEGSGLLEEKLKMSIDEKLRQLAVEKKDEVDSMLKVLRTKQEELESYDFLPLIQERDKREAALKEEIATLKTTLEEKELSESTLLQKDTQLLQKDAQLREQDVELKQQHTLLQQQKAQLKQKDAELRHNDEESGRQYAILLHEHQQLQQEHNQLRRERDQLQRESSRSLSAKPVVKKPPRNWKDMKCQKILKCSDECRGIATKGNHIAVGVPKCIKVYDRSSTDLLHTIGKGHLGLYLPGVTFYDQEHILVSDYNNNNIKMFTIQGQHVRTIDRGSTTFKPYGITISQDGNIYVCDGSNQCVCVFDVNGKFLFSFGSHGSGDECFDYPRDLCFASDGFLYITDVYNRRICVYDKDGKFIRKFTTTYNPWRIDATDCGHLIVSSFVSHKVMIYTTGGDLVHVFGEYGSELGQFKRPTGVSVDSDGLIYIVDFDNHQIQVL